MSHASPEGASIMPDDSKVRPESDYDVLYRIMTTRMSVRRIRPDPIPEEYVDKILEAGRWAMSGANGQPWEYLVIKDPKKKKDLYDAFQDTNQEFCFWMEQMRPFELRHPAFQVKGDDLKDEWQKIRNSTGGQQRRPWHEAPVVIVVLGDGRRQWATVNAAFTFGRHASHFTDGLANTCTHMQLAIASLGLGSHWGTVHVQEPLKRVLGVPDLIDVYLIISVGFADIELKPAARGAQAAQALARAGADGYTITYGTSGTYVNARFLFKNLAFDVLKDFAPISLAVSSPSYVAVHVSVPVNSLQELIDYAKRNPGKLEYSSSGVGSVFHLAGESLKLYAGIDLLHVPYAQANFPQMVNDWASGRVALWFPTYAFLVPNMPKVRPLAIVDSQRSARMPDVPTVAETLPNFRGFPAWWAFFGPAGLPSAIAERLSGEVRAALKQPEVVAKLGDLGLTTIGSTPEELAAYLRREIDAVGSLAKAIGLEPE